MNLPKTIPVALLLLITIGFSACHNYYMVANTNYQDDMANKLDSLNKQKKYFILRTGKQSFYMNRFTIDQPQRLISYTVDTLPLWHQLHLTNGNNKMQYRKQDNSDRNVLNEVHLYILPTDLTPGKTYQLPISHLQKIEVLIHDRKRSTKSKVAGGAIIVGCVTAGVLIAGAIALSSMTIGFY